MKTNIACLVLLVTLACTSCKKESSSLTAQNEPAGRSNPAAADVTTLAYQLVWSDEFDGTSVNTTNWNFEIGAGGWGNNEQQ